MKKYAFFVAAFALALAVTVTSTSCQKKNGLAAVGIPDTNDLPVFDTFDFPTAKYYFYGNFDGQHLLWQDSLRSAWDTATKEDGPEPWEEREDKKDNIYYNFTNIANAQECGSDSSWAFLENITYFIRPNNPYKRIEVYFYDCVDLEDTNSSFWPNNELSVFRQGANPFTNLEDAKRGVRVVYWDDNLEKWETKAGSGQLSSTYLRVTDFYPRELATDTLDTFGLYIVEGEFQGKLYNRNDKEMEVLGAKFRARLIPVDPY